MKKTVISLALLLAAGIASAATPTATPPGAVAVAIAGGLKLEASFKAPGGLTGWVLSQGVDTNLIVYTAADGTALAGNMLDASGKNLTKEHLAKYAPKADYSKLWSEVESSTWVAEGATGAAVKSTIYVMEDANCSFCHLTWKALQAYEKVGLQVRWIPVAFLSATSMDKAAALLAAPNPSEAFTARHQAYGSPEAKSAPSNPALVEKVKANNKLMQKWGFKGTPAVIYKDASGKVQTLGGMPGMSQLPGVTGLPAQANNDPDMARFR